MKGLQQAKYFMKIAKDTMFDFAKNTYDELPFQYKKGFTKEKIREIFVFVREKKPELFEDFYNYNVDSMEG
jgi:hypothetical protein